MLRTLTTTIILVTLASGAFAKAHDQGAADGVAEFGPGAAKDAIAGPGISSIVSKGQQGSSKKDPANRGGVEPVVGNGKNK